MMFFLDDQYIPPKEFQIESQMRVEGNKIYIKPAALRSNTTYTVVITEKVKALDGTHLEKPQTIRFSTEYLPLYASPLEVRGILKGLFTLFNLEDIYVAIRNASQKAHQLLGLAVDPMQSQFTILTENNSDYFAVNKFVIHEAAKTLINALLTQPIQRIIDKVTSSKTVTLGDFSVNQGEDNPEIKKEDVLDMIANLLGSIEENLKFWQDAMMNRNRRGYASPTTATSRGGVDTPESRDFEV